MSQGGENTGRQFQTRVGQTVVNADQTAVDSDSKADVSEDKVTKDLLQKSSSATLPSHVKLLVNKLESRYSTSVCRPNQPPPTLQSCPKIAALQDTLILRVQNSGTLKTSLPTEENYPKVTAVRDYLVSRVQVPETSKISPPVLQSCPKITALRETLISRVQDPGTSHTSRGVEDLAHCRSVASRQTALLDAARRAPAQRRSTITCLSLPRNALSNHRDQPKNGSLNSKDGLEADKLKVVPFDCEGVLRDGLSIRGQEPGDALPNDVFGPKDGRQEYGLSNPREVQENEDLIAGMNPVVGCRTVSELYRKMSS